MKLEDIRTIGVIGAGTMGHGIALSFALGGYPVRLNDVTDEILQNAVNKIRVALDMFYAEGMVTSEEAKDALERVMTTTDLGALASDADYICECIVEDTSSKKELFNNLDDLCPPHTILASNTSSLVLSDFGFDVKSIDGGEDFFLEKAMQHFTWHSICQIVPLLLCLLAFPTLCSL